MRHKPVRDRVEFAWDYLEVLVKDHRLESFPISRTGSYHSPRDKDRDGATKRRKELSKES